MIILKVGLNWPNFDEEQIIPSINEHKIHAYVIQEYIFQILFIIIYTRIYITYVIRLLLSLLCQPTIV